MLTMRTFFTRWADVALPDPTPQSQGHYQGSLPSNPTHLLSTAFLQMLCELGDWVFHRCT